MPSLEKTVEVQESKDFSLTRVSEDCTKSSIHIALIVVGTIIGIPIFLVSAQIGGALGLSKATPAFFAGSAVLCLLGSFTSLVGALSRYSTYKIIEFAFGRTGAKFVNFVIAMTLVGWFGVTGNIFGQAADMAIRESVGIERLAFILVPLMVAFWVYTNFLTIDKLPGWDAVVSFGSEMSLSEATSAIIGSYVVGVVIQPDYSRFAKNYRHSLWAMLISLGIVFPIVMILAAIPSIATSEVNLIKIMMALGIGVPAFILLLLGSWSSNVVGLYSSGLSLATIFTKAKLSKITLVVGSLGTALALSYTQAFFIQFLVILGVAIPPVAAIYIIDILIIRKGICDPEALEKEAPIDYVAFLVWIVATLIGVLSSKDIIFVSGISALDTIIVASLMYPIFRLQKILDSWNSLSLKQKNIEDVI